MKIFVVDLASHNNGVTHGAWFDLTDFVDADDLREAISEQLLLTSPFPNTTVTIDGREVPSSEEWAVHDVEDLPTEFGEYPDLDDLMAYVDLVEKHGAAVPAFAAVFGLSNLTEENFEDAYRGKYESLAEFVQWWMGEVHGWTGDESWYDWIDWDRAARDMQGDFTFTDGHVFYSNW